MLKNLIQGNPHDWPNGNARPLALLPWEPHDLPELAFTSGVDGRGEYQITVTETSDGWSFGLIYYPGSPIAGMGVYVVAEDDRMALALQALLRNLELDRDQLKWVSPLCEN